MNDLTFTVSVPDVGDVTVCPDDAALARRKTGEVVFSYKELDALDAAREQRLGGGKLALAIARVKKAFPSATINRILTTKEAKLDAGSGRPLPRNGIPAGDPRRQVGEPPQPPASAACQACGGEDDTHLDGCTMDGS